MSQRTTIDNLRDTLAIARTLLEEIARGRVILERSGPAAQHGELYGQIRELEQQCRNFIEQIEAWLWTSVAETSAAATLARMQHQHALQQQRLQQAATTLAGMHRGGAGPPRLGPRGVNQGDPLAHLSPAVRVAAHQQATQEEIVRVERNIARLLGARNELVGQLSQAGITQKKKITARVQLIDKQLAPLESRLSGLRSALIIQNPRQPARFTSKAPLRF